jgi:hypothetical protein
MTDAPTGAYWLNRTLDWFKANVVALHLDDAQVQGMRQLDAWQQHEQACCALVDAGSSAGDVEAACRAWYQWANTVLFAPMRQRVKQSCTLQSDR